MVLIPLERVHLQFVQLPLRTVQPAAVVDNLLQEQRIRSIDDGDVNLPIARETLKIRHQIQFGSQRIGCAGEEHRKIEVAARMRTSSDRRPELQQEPDAMTTSDVGERFRIHASLFHGRIPLAYQPQALRVARQPVTTGC